MAAAALLLSACAHLQPTACPTSAADQAQVDGAVRSFFDALRSPDEEALRGVTTASFFAFDGGKRFTGSELLAALREARLRGMQLSWNVGVIETRLGCDTAWAAWENVGSAGIPPKVEPVTWLESAVLVRVDGKWRIDFLHSSRRQGS